jgi:hypothetical protein
MTHIVIQVPVRRVSWKWIAESAAFRAGVADALAGHGYRPEYEQGGTSRKFDIKAITDWQWNYERSRQWVAIMGSVSPYDKNGKASRQAHRALVMLGGGIL